jgi:hypothetical protein
MLTQESASSNRSGRSSLTSLVARLINIAWFAAMMLLAVSVGLLVVVPWVDPPRVEIGLAVPAAFQLDPAAHPITARADVESVHLEHANGVIYFSPRSRVTLAVTAAVVIAVLLIALWVLGQLRALFCALRAGRPFVSANATRIRRIGYAVIGAELARAVLAYAGMRHAMTHFAVEGLRFETRVDVNAAALVCGLIILVIAEVFREGTRLADEQSLTV